MWVLGSVTFFIHKNPSKSINWAVCGFFLGNVVGWEQCRSIRRKQFQMMDKARIAKDDRNKERWQEKALDTDELLKKFQEFNEK